MKKFAKIIAGTILLTVLMSYIINVGVFYFFYKIHNRFKIDTKGASAKVVFFGSSRCVNMIIPNDFEKYTSLSCYNMGWAASNPREIYAAIKVYIIKNKKPDYIFVQLDGEHELTEPDDLAQQSLFKFYKKNIIDEYYTDQSKIILNTPLLPSILFRDFSWREILKTGFKNRLVDTSKGYAAVYGTIKDTKKTKAYILNKENNLNKNPWIQKAIKLCFENNIKVILFTSPYYKIKNYEDFDFLKMYGVPYFNLSKCNISAKFFRDNSHLNNDGAKIFTEIISEQFMSSID